MNKYQTIGSNARAWINDRPVREFSLTLDVDLTDTVSESDTYRPDPDWSWTDPAGHYHATNTGTESPPWPTLRQSVMISDDIGDLTAGTWACSICGWEVEPGMILDQPALSLSTEPGRRRWRMNARFPNGCLGALRPGELVSVRAVLGDRTLFGVFKITLMSTTEPSTVQRIEATSTGPLGTRDV